MTIDLQNFSVQDRTESSSSLKSADFDVNSLLEEGRTLNSNSSTERSSTPSSSQLDFGTENNLYGSNNQFELSASRNDTGTGSTNRILDHHSQPNANEISQFNSHDLNGNGSLNQSELTLAYMKNYMRSDSNNDRKIGREELSNAYEGSDPVAGMVADLGFDLGDSNQDNVMSLNDAYTASKELSNGTLGFKDSDGDSKLNREEFSSVSNVLTSPHSKVADTTSSLLNEQNDFNHETGELDLGSTENLYGSDFIKPGREAEAAMGHEHGCECAACTNAGSDLNNEATDSQADTFENWDLNNSGGVSQAELQLATMENLLSGDSNDNGSLEFDELNNLVKDKNPAEKFVARLGFMLNDTNRDGKLDLDETARMAKGLSQMGMIVADRNRDGQLDKGELSPYLPGDSGPSDTRPIPPRDIPTPPRDVPDPPRDTPEPPLDGVSRPSQEQLDQVMRQVENRGVSDNYMQELRESMAGMPASVVQAAIDGRTRILAVGQGRPGLGGSYNSGTNTVTMYESSPFSTKATLAAEMFHNWDLNPYVGKHVSSQGWFREAYQNVRDSGIRTGDNSLNNVYEFIHNMARYHSGFQNGVDKQIMDYLGPDYQRRTREALLS